MLLWGLAGLKSVGQISKSVNSDRVSRLQS